MFSHGAIEGDHNVMLGEAAEKMRDYLEDKYNDGVDYVLHYVTAREAYNIAKAAEAGKSGNPNDYRDFIIPPPVNRFLWASEPYEIISFEGGEVVLKFLVEPRSEVIVRLHAKEVSISGNAVLGKIEKREDETVIHLLVEGEGIIGLTFKSVTGDK